MESRGVIISNINVQLSSADTYIRDTLASREDADPIGGESETAKRDWSKVEDRHNFEVRDQQARSSKYEEADAFS